MHNIKIGFSAALLATCMAACMAADPANNPPPAEHHVQAQAQVGTSSTIDKTPDVDPGKQCSLYFVNQQQAPKFDYDQDQLRPDDRNLLDQVATCITSGPLKGRKIHLIGRADPRGTAEYNLALGDRRVRTVTDYLTRLGVDTSQIAISTRGALDASGNDERSWRLDRRVDLELQH